MQAVFLLMICSSLILLLPAKALAGEELQELRKQIDKAASAKDFQHAEKLCRNALELLKDPKSAEFAAVSAQLTAILSDEREWIMAKASMKFEEIGKNINGGMSDTELDARAAEMESCNAYGPCPSYMCELERRIKRAWFPPRDGNRVRVLFKIHKNGKLSDLQINTSSGQIASEQAALMAVVNASPFHPLPKGAPSVISIEFTFDYNIFRPSRQSKEEINSWNDGSIIQVPPIHEKREVIVPSCD